MMHAIFLAVLGATAPYVAAYEAPTATLANGIVVGTTTSLYAATSAVNKYLGIPYASSPPVRFSPPSPAVNWTSPKNVSTFGPACIQQTGLLSAFGVSELLESEDCLYLNVFQPGGVVPTNGWPVMVWIYGGALQFGSADVPYYDGSRFAAYEDVILVTFNYRVSIFGFPGAPGVPNLGFLDQRLALSWVQNNIKAFGGDPKKVTIFGESAGGISVDALLTAPPASQAFQAAIIQSGTVLSNVLAGIGGDPSKNWNLATAAFNCTSTFNAVECLRAISALDLKAFATTNSLPISPVVDNITYIPNSAQQRASGRAANVPVLIGTTADEGTILTYGQTNLTAFIAAVFGALPALEAQVTQAYAVGTPGISTQAEAISRIFTEAGLQCPSAVLTRQVSAAGRPAWRYLYNATFPNLSPLADLGAYHSSEIPMVFSTYNATTATAQQYALSNYMRGAWAQFARNPLSGPGWGSIAAFNGTDLALLGFDGSSGATVVSPSTSGIDARCDLYTALYDFLG